MKRTGVGIALLLLGFVGVGIYLLLQADEDFRVMDQEHWTDRELIEHFRKNQQTFEWLCRAAMSKTALFAITASDLSLESKQEWSQDEIKAFRDALRNLRVEGVTLAVGGTRLVIVSTTRGWFSHESEKGYVCMRGDEPPGELAGSLDRISRTESKTLYMPIERNWYLHYSGY